MTRETIIAHISPSSVSDNDIVLLCHGGIFGPYPHHQFYLKWNHTRSIKIVRATNSTPTSIKNGINLSFHEISISLLFLSHILRHITASNYKAKGLRPMNQSHTFPIWIHIYYEVFLKQSCSFDSTRGNTFSIKFVKLCKQ